jgi:hypothetical protein
MKKLLSLLGAIGLVATSSATVVSCDTDSDTTLQRRFTTDLTNVQGEWHQKILEAVKTTWSYMTQMQCTNEDLDQLTMQITHKDVGVNGEATMPEICIISTYEQLSIWWRRTNDSMLN